MKKTEGATRQPAALPTTGLWTFPQVCAYFGVSERKGHQMRAANVLPDAIVLGRRCLRWAPDEVKAAAAQRLPREKLQSEPAQLVAARQQRTTAGA